MHGYSAAAFGEHVGELASLGIAGVVLMVPASTRAHFVDTVAAFSEEVLSAAR
jgi:hypothetical protein